MSKKPWYETALGHALTFGASNPDICNGCTGSCSSSCTGTCTGGCNGCSGCNTTCTGSCKGSCAGCGATCGNACSTSCTTSCKGCTGCGTGCSSGCSGCTGCGSGCASGCTGCSGCSSCTGTCSGGCLAGCSGKCYGTCNSACGNQCTNGATKNLETFAINTLNTIQQTELTFIINAIKYEVSRRKLTPTEISVVTGDLINIDKIQTIIEELKKVNSKTTIIAPKEIGQKAYKDLFENIIRDLKAPWNEIIDPEMELLEKFE